MLKNLNSPLNGYKPLISLIAISGLIFATDARFSIASATNFYFVPAGTQLDGDPILDIIVSPGDNLSFDVFLDATGVNNDPLGTLNAFWDFTFDPDELQFLGTTDGPGIVSSVVPNSSNNYSVVNGLVLAGVNNRLLTVNFLVTNPGIHPHDGVVDFGITLTGVTGTGGSPDFTSQFPAPSKNEFDLSGTQFNQVVEVQTPEPSSAIGFLALGTLGLGATLKRKLKSRTSPESRN